MKILIACDKYKGSLSAGAVCNTIKNALESKYPDYSCKSIPMADGGDGTLEVLAPVLQLSKTKIQVLDPFSRPIHASYFHNNQTAFIELASASGIKLLSENELDVLNTSTTGTGQLFKHAYENGYRDFVLAIGGSCTNEMGLGIAREMGFEFFDFNEEEIVPKGGNLLSIHSIKYPVPLPDIKIEILCDVDNPLYGPNGAASIYGPQKGANKDDIELLDKGVKHIADLIEKTNQKSVSQLEGGGAAGGIASGLYGLFERVSIHKGMDVISELLDLESEIKNADLVISGEGKLDDSSFSGKVIGYLADRCKALDKKIIAIVGDKLCTEEVLKSKGVHSVHSLVEIADSKEDCINEPEFYLRQVVGHLDL